MAKQDTYTNRVNDTFPYGACLYWLDDTLLGDDDINTIPLTHSGAIVSLQFTPYINSNELIIDKIPYDTKRFMVKDKEGYVNIPFDTQPYVYRIKSIKETAENKKGIIQKRLGTFKCYKKTNIKSGSRDWKWESKLQQYPYSLAYLYDGIMQPQEIHYHLCTGNNVEVWSRSVLNINADYSIFIKNYKQDYVGNLEQFTCTTNKELPTTSNQYAQWLATSKNQMENNVQQTMLSSIVTGAISGSMVNVGLGTLVGATIGAGVNIYSAIQSNKASVTDMRNKPNSLISRGGDFMLGMNTTAKTLSLYRYRQCNESMQQLGDYFHMFGYKQNKIMDINTRSRRDFNFIKTIGVNINTLKGIPQQHLDKLKSIYDNGVTIWHIDTVGNHVGNYATNNIERNLL